jgi:serine/threonine protein kinase
VTLVRVREQEIVCKRLAPQALESHEGRAAMVREAKLLSIVDHPALPQLVRVGNDAHGPFFLETFVEGTSLRGLRQGWSVRGKPIPTTLIRHVIIAALESLAEVHELADAQGPLDIVHGDISPDHLLFSPFGDVRFVDLGAARFRGLDADVDTNDRGTVPYAAPEIVRGDTKPGQTTDVYALCATLIWFATGAELCAASTDAAKLAEVAVHGVRRELVDNATALDPRERECFRAALDPDPTRRPSSVREILRAFDTDGPQRDIASEAR